MKTERRKKILGILLSVFVLVGIVLGVLKYQQSVENRNNDVEQGTVMYNSEFKTNAPGNLVFPAYNKDIVAKEGDKEVPIVLANPKVNKNVYFQYVLSVEVDNTKEYVEIGRSKLIASGRALNKLQLSEKKMHTVMKGKHKCRLDVYAFTYNEKDNKKIKLNQAYWDFNMVVQ